MKMSSNLLTPGNHSLLLADYEGQMSFATQSIPISELRNNVAIVAGASKILIFPQ